MKKAAKIIAGIFIVSVMAIIIFMFTIGGQRLPWKIIDPHDPRFVEENFRFSDYGGKEYRQYFVETLRVMLPVGTPKGKVDKILYGNQRKYTKSFGGAYSGQENMTFKKADETNVWVYAFVPAILPINKYLLHVYYDENNRVKEIADHGVPIFNPDYFNSNNDRTR